MLMVPASADESPRPVEAERLLELSAEAAGSSHPAMICLQKAGEGSGDKPSIRHNEERDWWIARLMGRTSEGDKSKKLALELVVAGYAEE